MGSGTLSGVDIIAAGVEINVVQPSLLLVPVSPSGLGDRRGGNVCGCNQSCFRSALGCEDTPTARDWGG